MFLCGLLYVFGLMLGFNYEEISVYVCIYGLPILFIVMALAVTVVAVYRWLRRMTFWNTLNFMASSCVSYAFWKLGTLFIDFYTNFSELHPTLKTIHDKFVACQNDLMRMASDLGTTYEEINLIIYAYIPIFLTIGLWLWFELTCPGKFLLNRLWKKNSPSLGTLLVTDIKKLFSRHE